MAKNEASKNIEDFLNFVKESEERYKMAGADLEQTHNETQDILHRLELYDVGHHEAAACAKKLKSVRRRRRTAKDTMEELEPIVRWAYENRAGIGQIQRVLGEVRKEEQRHENRFYLPKTKILEE